MTITEPQAPAPVPGYIYSGPLFEPQRLDDWPMLFGNFLALIPVGGGVLFLWLPYQLYLTMGMPGALFADVDWSLFQKILAGGVAFLPSSKMPALFENSFTTERRRSTEK